jgi:hypothetical protein
MFVAFGSAATVIMTVAGSAHASASCSASSGREAVPLVELFTSEGCSSCPPADRWLSTTFPATAAPATAAVLAFHVDYWDRLGWKDRFAAAAYTERQYAAMQANGATFVYTPQLLVQGRDAELGRGERTAELLASARRRPARATITLEADVADDGRTTARVAASVADAALRRNAVVWLAYTDSGHVSDVKAGENRGVRLRHDHVVRALSGPFAVDARGEARATATWRRPAERGSAAALVAVVQDAQNGDVLQTLILPACIGG